MSQTITRVFNQDCMIGMKQYPDKYFELAIVDPPYGINADKNLSTKLKKHGFKEHNKGKTTFFDSSIPSKEYFIELFRVSKNQIIWGGNYMVEHLPSSQGWIFWDKGNYGFSFADGELAFSSFDRSLKRVLIPRGKDEGILNGGGNTNQNTIHPTQKPIKLYKWLLTNYAKQGDKILDTHLGSGSSRIAAHQLGFDFTGFELDKEYFDASVKRFNLVTSQEQIQFPKTA